MTTENQDYRNLDESNQAISLLPATASDEDIPIPIMAIDENKDDSDLESNNLLENTKNNINENYNNISYELFNFGYKLIIPLFFALSFFTYFDRGVLSASLDTIQTQLLHNSSFQSGSLASCYLLGYCLTSPIFALMGSYHPPLKMSGIGMTVWCLACACTGLFSNFYLLALARLLTGIGEASFLSFTATIIDTIAPNETRSRWLGFYYTAIPLGYAFGDAIGGTITDTHIYYSNGNNESWRAGFILEAIIVFPMVLMICLMKSPSNMLIIQQLREKDFGSQNEIIEVQTDDKWTVKLKRVLTNPTFLTMTAGYATQTFVTGTFSVEAISYLENVYGWQSNDGGIAFGGLTLLTGLLGSIFGGYTLDKMKDKEIDAATSSTNHDGKIHDYFFVRPSINLLTTITLLTFPAVFIIFQFHNIYLFFVCVAIAEFFIFASQGPVNNAILWCSVFRDRPLASALSTFCIHLFGDACAPVVVGAIIDAKEKTESAGNAYNFALSISSWYIACSAIFFYCGRFTLNKLRATMKLYGE